MKVFSAHWVPCSKKQVCFIIRYLIIAHFAFIYFQEKSWALLCRPVFHSFEQYYEGPVRLVMFENTWPVRLFHTTLFNYQIVQIYTKWMEFLFCIPTCYFSWNGFRFYSYLSKVSNSVANFRSLVPQGLKVSTPIEIKWYVVSGEFIYSIFFSLYFFSNSVALPCSLMLKDTYTQNIKYITNFINFIVVHSSKLSKRSGNCTWILQLFDYFG